MAKERKRLIVEIQNTILFLQELLIHLDRLKQYINQNSIKFSGSLSKKCLLINDPRVISHMILDSPQFAVLKLLSNRQYKHLLTHPDLDIYLSTPHRIISINFEYLLNILNNIIDLLKKRLIYFEKDIVSVKSDLIFQYSIICQILESYSKWKIKRLELEMDELRFKIDDNRIIIDTSLLEQNKDFMKYLQIIFHNNAINTKVLSLGNKELCYELFIHSFRYLSLEKKALEERITNQWINVNSVKLESEFEIYL